MSTCFDTNSKAQRQGLSLPPLQLLCDCYNELEIENVHAVSKVVSTLFRSGVLKYCALPSMLIEGSSRAAQQRQLLTCSTQRLAARWTQQRISTLDGECLKDCIYAVKYLLDASPFGIKHSFSLFVSTFPLHPSALRIHSPPFWRYQERLFA